MTNKAEAVFGAMADWSNCQRPGCRTYGQMMHFKVRGRITRFVHYDVYFCDELCLSAVYTWDLYQYEKQG